MPEVVCLGILVADVIGHPIDAVPARGSLQLVPAISLHLGGCAANTGLGLQKLGVETLVIGRVGRDGFGAFVRGELEKAGLKTQIEADENAPTAATMVLVGSDAERSFLHCTGANASFDGTGLDLAAWQGARWLHIAGHGLMPRFDGANCARLLQKARKNGMETSLDTAGAPDDAWRENLRQCLPFLSCFLPSWHEVEALFPDAATPQSMVERLLETDVQTVALKMGERGCIVGNREKIVEIAPFSIAAIDSTGAGDAFAAGFLAGLTRGFTLEECASLGNAVGALCVTRVGTSDGLLNWSQTLDWMRQNG